MDELRGCGYPVDAVDRWLWLRVLWFRRGWSPRPNHHSHAADADPADRRLHGLRVEVLEVPDAESGVADDGGGVAVEVAPVGHPAPQRGEPVLSGGEAAGAAGVFEEFECSAGAQYSPDFGQSGGRVGDRAERDASDYVIGAVVWQWDRLCGGDHDLDGDLAAGGSRSQAPGVADVGFEDGDTAGSLVVGNVQAGARADFQDMAL
jgi:hypothetical protein